MFLIKVFCQDQWAKEELFQSLFYWMFLIKMRKVGMFVMVMMIVSILVLLDVPHKAFLTSLPGFAILMFQSLFYWMFLIKTDWEQSQDTQDYGFNPCFIGCSS